jgi:hypothetical protein
LDVRREQRLLGLQVRVGDGVRREAVPDLAEEVVAEEGEAGPVGQDEHAEVGVDGHVVGVDAADGAGGDDAAAVREAHLAVLHQGLEHGDDLQRRLVGLVDHEAPPLSHGLHQRGVLPHHAPVDERRGQGELAHRRVAVQLDVLPLNLAQLQHPVRDLVLAHALVADEQDGLLAAVHVVHN